MDREENCKDERFKAKAVEYTILQYQYKGEIIKYKHPECPYCRHHGKVLWNAGVDRIYQYCYRCGQKLDWSSWTNKLDE